MTTITDDADGALIAIALWLHLTCASKNPTCAERREEENLRDAKTAVEQELHLLNHDDGVDGDAGYNDDTQ